MCAPHSRWSEAGHCQETFHFKLNSLIYDYLSFQSIWCVRPTPVGRRQVIAKRLFILINSSYSIYLTNVLGVYAPDLKSEVGIRQGVFHLSNISRWLTVLFRNPTILQLSVGGHSRRVTFEINT